MEGLTIGIRVLEKPFLVKEEGKKIFAGEKKDFLKTTLPGLKKQAEGMGITNHNELAGASLIVSNIKQAIKALDKERIEIVAPIKKQAAEVDQEYKAATNPLEEIQRIVEKKCKDFLIEEKAKADKIEKERLAEIARLEAKKQAELDEALKNNNDKALDRAAEAEKAEAEAKAAPEAAPAPIKKIDVEGTKTNFIDRWKYDIINTNEIPESYTQRIADDKKIKAAIDMGIREIPGIRIYNDPIMSSNRSK